MKKKTAKMFVMLGLMVFSCQFFLFAGTPGEAITWETDWNKALSEAVKAQRPVLMDFYTDWCPPCKKLAAVTFTDEKMIGYFKKENYMLIKVNPEKDRAAEAKFKVYSYPTLVIFNPKGAEIDRILGFKSTGELIEALEDLKKGIGTLEDLRNRLEKIKAQKTKETFELMFKIMSKYIAKADYPEALELVARIVTMDKDNAQKQASSALYQKGYIYYKWKKYKEAIDTLLSVGKVYPDSEEAEVGHAAAAYYSEKLEDPGLTLKLLKDFLKKYPDGKNAGRCRKRIEELEKSREK